MVKEAKPVDKHKNYILSFTHIFVGIFLGYFFMYPSGAGVVGGFLKDKMFIVFGDTIFFLPFLFFMVGIRYLREEILNWKLLLLGFFLTIFFSSNILALMFSAENGGVIGNFCGNMLVYLIGQIGTYLLSIFAIVLGLYFLNFDVIMQITRMLRGCVNCFNKSEKPPKDEPNVVEPIQKEEPKKREPIVEVKNDSGDYKLPPISLLDKPKLIAKTVTQDELKQNAVILQTTLKNFGVEGTVVNILPGPVITRYEVELAPGVKVASIVSLQNDICLAMKAQTVMIISPIPGKSAIGIELPNKHTQPVVFRDIIEDEKFKTANLALPFAIGKTVSGHIAYTDIAKTPHLLIAGATGSGKSVCVNSLIMSILYTKRPDEVKFIMVDPKVVELAFYRDIPHLYSPVITNPKEASRVLQQVVMLMESRYEKFAEEGARNIESYNEKMDQKGFDREFYLIVIIDELADLMLVASKDVEESIVRLTQKARAVGIHVVLATQRPSVNVVTGIIKANLPSRIAFQVLSKIDSRVILDTNGADSLLGKGDMLFLENGVSKPVRLQGAFLSEKEVQNVIKFIKNQAVADYSHFKAIAEKMTDQPVEMDNKNEEELKRALNLVLDRQKISYDLMRANGFSGPKTTNLISLMELQGFIRKPNGAKQWEIDFDAIGDYLKKGSF